MNNDLFEITEARDLFYEAQTAFSEYSREPTSRLLLFLLFSLNHLREWIAKKSYDELRRMKAAGVALLPNENLFFDVGDLAEFRVINALCNRSKHHTIRQATATSISRGMTCDGTCNDSLDQLYYRIDGVDSRKVFLTVLQAYQRWFLAHANQVSP